jgi:hypothetical protein
MLGRRFFVLFGFMISELHHVTGSFWDAARMGEFRRRSPMMQIACQKGDQKDHENDTGG